MSAPPSSLKRAAAQASSRDESLPRWERSLSFRGLAYRSALHQNDVMGIVKARVLEARGLRRLDWSYLRPLASLESVNCYVQLGLGARVAGGEPICTSVVRSNARPTWARQDFLMPVLKSRVAAARAVRLDVQAFHSDSVVSHILPAMIRGSNSLGLGQLDLAPLLLGEARVLDVWVPLATGAGPGAEDGGELGEDGGDAQGKERGPGKTKGEGGAGPLGPAVHLVVEYEPEGMQPQRGDVVYPEPFARSPVSQVLPPGEPLCVLEVSGPWLLAGFASPHSDFRGQIKVHRNTVFVVERLTLVDGIWSRALQPTDFLFGTSLGRYVRSVAGPYLTYVNTLLTPVYMASHVGLGTLRLAIRSAAAGVSASGSTVLGTDRRFVRRARR